MALRNSPVQPSTPFELRSIITREYVIYAEYLELCRRPCDGVFVIPSDSSPSRWLCVISVIGGLYDGGIFRFELVIPETLVAPIVVFRPPIFHPMVDPVTGEFDVSHKYPQWTSSNRTREVLQYVKMSLSIPESNVERNSEAAKLLLEDQHEYRRIVREEISRTTQLLENEEHAPANSRLSFGSWIPDIHQPVLQKMLERRENIEKADLVD